MAASPDIIHLRAAIAASRSAREKGNKPYGAVLVSLQGEILATAENSQVLDRDCTAHAETNLVRTIGAIDAAVLRDATLYASGEPCPMCAGAILNAGIGRIVFALRRERMQAITGDRTGIAMNAAELLSTATPNVTVEGPLLEDEAAGVLLGR